MTIQELIDALSLIEDKSALAVVKLPGVDWEYRDAKLNGPLIIHLAEPYGFHRRSSLANYSPETHAYAIEL